MRAFLVPLAAALMALAIALPGSADEPQASSPFSPAEREALHAEIRGYLLAHPEVLQEMIALLEQKQQAATAENDRNLVAMNADAIFDDGFSWVGGNPEGAFTLVEFLDYQCGFCRRAQPEVVELLASDGDIRLIVKEMPILGPGSELAARAAVATMIAEGEEKYAALHAKLMTVEGGITDASLDAALTEVGLDPAAIRAAMQDPEVERRLGETRALAEKLAIAGTPTFVFDDRMVRGYLPLAQMRALVAEVREDG
ncbi:DsbA family protein [uncultured Amaricoccus sp.]|uniref:DsbA family protein n=1 Tax=uncultured Amaricoccus sp. TaxID=339341 RepID=UPI0026064415|nr:DsbA family protein [uncultured Amaricoccus sp.]